MFNIYTPQNQRPRKKRFEPLPVPEIHKLQGPQRLGDEDILLLYGKSPANVPPKLAGNFCEVFYLDTRGRTQRMWWSDMINQLTEKEVE